jgi:hypothetical protein
MFIIPHLCNTISRLIETSLDKEELRGSYNILLIKLWSCRLL